MDIQPENLQPEQPSGEITENTSIQSVETEPLLGSESGQWESDESVLPKRSNFQDYLLLFSITSTVVALDQFTKWLVRVNIDVGRSWDLLPEISPYFRVVHWHNTGAAFGLFEDGNAIFTILALVVSAAIIYYYPQVPREDWAVRIALGLQMGGALGNFTDRILRGFVTDWASFWNFPVFNVADASISIGVVFLIVGMWLTEEERKAEELESGELEPGGERHAEGPLALEEISFEDVEDSAPEVDALPESPSMLSDVDNQEIS